MRSGTRRLNSVRILVADDNEVSRLVLQSMLGSEGALVSMAENGRQAVDAVAAAPDAFDMVLMDVQMPQMDGRAATQEIHCIAPALPVLGQTAHVLAAEHLACIDAGMIATIGKPIGHEQLIHEVQRHLAPTLVHAAPARRWSEPQPSAGATGIIDWRRLHASHAAMPSLVDQLLAIALEGYVSTGDRLRQVAHSGDFEELRKIAHNLKGTAGHFFADPLRECARQVETATRNNDSNLVTLTATLAEMVEAFVDEIRRHASGSPPASKEKSAPA